MNNIFDEKLSVTHFADGASLGPLACLRVWLGVWEYSRLFRAIFTVAQGAERAVNHLIFVLELMTAGWTLFYAFPVGVGRGFEEDRIVSIENNLPFRDLKFAGLLKKFLYLALMLYGLQGLAMDVEGMASLKRE